MQRIEQTATASSVSGNGFERDTRKRVIVAIPPTLAGRHRLHPAMPALRDQLTQRMPMGTVIKVQCVYDEPFWRADGLAGQATSDTGPVEDHVRQLPAGRHGSRARRADGIHRRLRRPRAH